MLSHLDEVVVLVQGALLKLTMEKREKTENTNHFCSRPNANNPRHVMAMKRGHDFLVEIVKRD